MARDRVRVYLDGAGRWRWSRRAGGRVVADSGQGYRSKWWAKTQARRKNPGTVLIIAPKETP